MAQPAQRLPHVSPARIARLRSLFRILEALSPRLAARLGFMLFLKPMRRELQANDAQFMAGAKLHLLRSGADRVQVYEWGTGDRTVLIAHGWGSRASRFAPMARALLERGWRVLAFDAPGHGLSPGRSSSLPQFMAAMNQVATQLGPVQALIGHSLGGLAIACERQKPLPAWFASLQKVVLISVPDGAAFLIDSFLQMLGIGSATARHMHTRFSQRFGSPQSYVVTTGSPLHLATLVVHDRGDDIVPFAHSEQLLPKLAAGRMLTTETLGHSALTRDAATISSIADFLDEPA
jgi:predicted alpha/beta hydrolase family esterase